MNLKEFLEEEHVLFTRATFSSSETLHEWFKKHDTRLINKVLEEVQMEVEKLKYQQPLLGTPETTERIISAVNKTTEEVSTIIESLKVK